MRIICTLPNASESINGIPFMLDPASGAMISTGDVPDDAAIAFLDIPGYAEHQAPSVSKRTRSALNILEGTSE